MRRQSESAQHCLARATRLESVRQPHHYGRLPPWARADRIHRLRQARQSRLQAGATPYAGMQWHT
eukprot:5143340-Alexandrium_andersonii.AAC.1